MACCFRASKEVGSDSIAMRSNKIYNMRYSISGRGDLGRAKVRVRVCFIRPSRVIISSNKHVIRFEPKRV